MEKRQKNAHNQTLATDWATPRRWLVFGAEQRKRCVLGDRVKALVFAALALALAQGTASAANLTAECPITLPAGAVSVRAPTGWVGGQSQGLVRLTSYGMMAGAPETMTYLVPSRSNSGRITGSSTWIFGRGDEKWLYCQYGESTAILVAKRLDDAATSCTVTRTSDKRGSITRAAVACVSR